MAAPQRLRVRALAPMSRDRAAYVDDALLCIATDGTIASFAPYAGETVDTDLRAAGVVTPGFVDAHVHFPQARIVGRASGALLDWLDTTVFPEEARFADGAYADAVARRFVESLLRAGTTTAFIYGSVHASASDALFSALDRSGMRAIAGPVWMDCAAPPELLVPADLQAAGLLSLCERWHGREDRLFVALIPRFAVSCSPSMLAMAAAFARNHSLWVSTHLAETQAEGAAACARHGGDNYLDIYVHNGLVGPRTVLAHCIHLSPADWDRLASLGAVVAHCPDSNAFLGSGSMPIGALVERGIGLTLGSDVAAGRTLNMAAIASMAFDNALRTGTKVSPAAWFWTLTAGGAAALGFPNVGRLSPGYAADLVLHPISGDQRDGDAVLDSLLFDRDRDLPRAVWIAGRLVVGDALVRRTQHGHE